MSKLTCAGVSDASDAFAISDDGKQAFLFDRKNGIVIRQNLENGERTRLIWTTQNYGDSRYVCYSMFQWKRLEDGQGPDRIGLLLFDDICRSFQLILFTVASNNNLIPLKDFTINFSHIRSKRFSYSSHKHDGKLQVIFYERYDENQKNKKINFCYYAVDLSTFNSFGPKNGILPSGGNWELPFVAEKKLHFISFERNANKIAPLPMSFLASDTFVIDSLQGRNFPHRSGIWCHAWEHGIPFFATARKSTSMSQTLLSLWFIDLCNKQWQKIGRDIQIPLSSKNFAIRAASNNSVILHFDATQTAAFFYKFDVSEALRSIRLHDSYEIEIPEMIIVLESPQLSANFVEVECPICLKTFIDPRKLFCGHSVCFGCLATLRVFGGTCSRYAKCPKCRKFTNVPEAGLPKNHELQG